VGQRVGVYLHHVVGKGAYAVHVGAGLEEPAVEYRRGGGGGGGE